MPHIAVSNGGMKSFGNNFEGMEKYKTIFLLLLTVGDGGNDALRR